MSSDISYYKIVPKPFSKSDRNNGSQGQEEQGTQGSKQGTQGSSSQQVEGQGQSLMQGQSQGQGQNPGQSQEQVQLTEEHKQILQKEDEIMAKISSQSKDLVDPETNEQPKTDSLFGKALAFYMVIVKTYFALMFKLGDSGAKMIIDTFLPTELSQQIFSENINVIHASNAHSMHQAVLKHINNQDIFISVAAVSDYKPKEIFKGKLKKDNSDITLQLTPTIDILKEIGLSKNKIFKVGFAAESENLIENAQKKLKEKNLDLIVANLIHESMGLEDTKISIIDQNNVVEIAKSNKIVAAKAILKEIAHRIHSDK